MLTTDFSTNCALKFIQNTDSLITLGNTSAESKRLGCTIAYNNIESTLPHHVFLYKILRNLFELFLNELNVNIVSE